MNACAARGVGALPHQELRELALLYRQTAADLSIARDDPASAALARYLNTLLGRAHNVIYAGNPEKGRGIIHFYTRVFPGVCRQTLPYTLTALAIFACGMFGGLVIAWSDPGFERLILGGAMLDTIGRGEMWTHSIVAIKPLAASAIMKNNLSVSFAAFGGGILAGLGTVYLMFFNGLLMGVIAVACDRAGMSLSLWSFVAPHGVLELPAIFIAGGAGLLIGKGMLVPGLQSRRDSLAEASALAVQLLLGVIPLLIVAGTIEGFVSPSSVSVATKFTIAASGLILLAAYVFFVQGRPDIRRADL